MESEAKILDHASIDDNRNELSKKVTELKASKWVSDNKTIIADAVIALRSKALLEKARKSTSTQSLSMKKSEVTEHLITSNYTKRFNTELIKIGAGRLPVHLVKTRTVKGRVYFQLKLKDTSTKVPIQEVLSEGEFRIISLAAFLADLTGRRDSFPFVFDDPISSLDQDYEEAMVQRIVDLAIHRQVIVFTHRISFLTMLHETAKDSDVDNSVVGLSRESWGTGEPGETPLSFEKPERALNRLLNDNLLIAKNKLEQEGTLAYEIYAKGMCSSIRICTESIVENILLNEIVLRYRRDVKTKGKLSKLIKINGADCQTIDDAMTKYSRYEHSQSGELPVILPTPDEIETDIKHLQLWIKDFKNRTVNARVI